MNNNGNIYNNNNNNNNEIYNTLKYRWVIVKYMLFFQAYMY